MLKGFLLLLPKNVNTWKESRITQNTILCSFAIFKIKNWKPWKFLFTESKF